MQKNKAVDKHAEGKSQTDTDSLMDGWIASSCTNSTPLNGSLPSAQEKVVSVCTVLCLKAKDVCEGVRVHVFKCMCVERQKGRERERKKEIVISYMSAGTNERESYSRLSE